MFRIEKQLLLAGIIAFVAFSVLPAFAEETGSTPSDTEAASAETENAKEEKPEAQVVPGITVIGSKEAVQDLPGSGFFLGGEEIRQHSYDDINRALRKVPGVYLREEDGFGMFQNISLRGVDSSRSSKVTLMEDGVMMAPAPYSAPEAYFSPTTGRMRGIEVLKGSSQIMYGPHITGGVVNYLSTEIPEESTGYFKFLYGSNNDYRIHTHYGDTYQTDHWGKIGFVGELWFRSNEGFKDIDDAPGYHGGESGFTHVEPMFKMMWEPDSDRYQRFEFKYGYTDRDAEETYLGLSDADFNKDPYRRYTASRFDRIDTYQNRAHLRHFIELDDIWDVTSTLYYNQFHRNWYKLNDLRNIDTNGDGVGDGVNQSLSGALAGQGGGVGLEVLRGQRAGDLRVRANNRDYYAYGISVDPRAIFETGSLEHELKFGLRYHYDAVERFQHDDIYRLNSSGEQVDFFPGAPGSQDNRRETTDAVAFYLQDKIKAGKLTVIPGVRVEHLWQEAEDFRLNTAGSTDYTVAGGGVGFSYELNDRWTALGGVHRGFSTPSPAAAIEDHLGEESSLAFEGGVRYQSPRKALTAEAIGFFTYFDDLIVVSNLGGSGSTRDENVGRVDTVGVELLLQYDPGLANDWGFNMPSYASFTFTDAHLVSDSNSTDPESIFAGGKKGNKVPYIPPHIFTLGTGIELPNKFGIFVTGSFVDEVFTTALNTPGQVNAAGAPDARFGVLDSHFVVDLSAYYQVAEGARIVGGAHNLFDEECAASRHPHGLRPGAPQFLYIGMEFNF